MAGVTNSFALVRIRSPSFGFVRIGSDSFALVRQTPPPKTPRTRTNLSHPPGAPVGPGNAGQRLRVPRPADRRYSTYPPAANSANPPNSLASNKAIFSTPDGGISDVAMDSTVMAPPASATYQTPTRPPGMRTTPGSLPAGRSRGTLTK